MGFFDEYKDTGKWDFVSKDEREVLIKEAVPFVPEKVIEVPSKDPKYKDQYVIFTRLPGDPDTVRAIGFGKDSVESRDAMLVALKRFLEKIEDGEIEDEAPTLYIERKGASQLLKNAEAKVTA
jgi:hypothetical protein